MTRRKLLIEILLFAIGIVALYFGVYKGSMLVLGSGQSLGEKQDSLTRWENRQSIVQALNNKVKDATFKDELHIAMPLNPKTGEFLTSVQGAAQKAGVIIQSFSPSSSNLENQVNLNESAQTDTIQPATLASYSTDLSVSGEYSQIYAFLDNLEKIKRVMQISQINISKTESSTLTANISLVVYYLKN